MSKENNHTDQLARWLNGELSPEESKSFDQDPDLADLKMVVDDIDTWKITPLNIEDSFEKLQLKKEAPEAKVVSLTPWIRIAASVALLVMAYIGWNFFFNNEVLIQTGIAEKQEVELPDGSTIQLDASSSLAYTKRNWEENRVVTIKGQAYLDVESGGSFEVNTAKGNVSVLGTEFNVEVSESVFEVQCFEGSVLVASGNLEQTLTENEGTRLSNNQLDKLSIEEQPDWISGFSKFEQAPLSEVVLEFKKYYDVTIELPEEYQSLEFTGQFTHDNLTQALRSVFATMEISYTLTGDTVDFN